MLLGRIYYIVCTESMEQTVWLLMLTIAVVGFLVLCVVVVSAIVVIVVVKKHRAGTAGNFYSSRATFLT